MLDRRDGALSRLSKPIPRLLWFLEFDARIPFVIIFVNALASGSRCDYAEPRALDLIKWSQKPNLCCL